MNKLNIRVELWAKGMLLFTLMIGTILYWSRPPRIWYHFNWNYSTLNGSVIIYTGKQTNPDLYKTILSV